MRVPRRSRPEPDAATTASPPAAVLLAGETAGLEALIRACGLDIRDADDGVSPILAGADAPLGAALTLERKALQILFASRDKAEGMTAFLEKRAPRYRGE